MGESWKHEMRKRELETEAEAPHAGEGEGSREHGEEQKIQEAKSLDAKSTYEVIRREGLHELERSTSALAWSGLAAGLSMGFSFMAPAMIRAHTPPAAWQPLLVALGYPLGFVVVILGRQQLFTENTLTVMLPLFRQKDASTLGNVLRLWGAVLAANIVGALVIAFVLARTVAVQDTVYEAMLAIGRETYQGSFAVTLLRGVFAGWIIALVVWLLPFAETGRVWVIVLLTYFIGLGDFSHVIAGAADAAFMVFVGERSWTDFTIGFLIPALVGNIAGGVSLVAALNHAQVVSGEEGGVDA